MKIFFGLFEKIFSGKIFGFGSGSFLILVNNYSENFFTGKPRKEFPLQSPLCFLKFALWSGYCLHEGVFGVKIKSPFLNP